MRLVISRCSFGPNSGSFASSSANVAFSKAGVILSPFKKFFSSAYSATYCFKVSRSSSVRI